MGGVDDVLYLVSDRRSCSELEIRNTLSAFRHGVRPKINARAKRMRFECAYNTFTPLPIRAFRDICHVNSYSYTRHSRY
jgi:hypothetical protein